MRIRVSGVVQGVGFRWFVREEARRLALTGWVRNEADGSVLLEAAGTPRAMEALIVAVSVGPPGSHVRHVEQEAIDADTTSLPNPFSVLR
jgi:acylphosphatase